jgi:uncharacterized SAM-binding protein YcdF (DUF218 family)
MRRVVAVLGYSPRRSRQLHPVCSARIERACGIAREGDLVVLSGWSRHPGAVPEAELMARAWNGPAVELVCETDARHTAGNVAAVATLARSYGASELVLVTSWWHRLRATTLLRFALRGSRVRVTGVPAPSPAAPTLLLRELGCLAALPVQLLALTRPGEGQSL